MFDGVYSAPLSRFMRIYVAWESMFALRIRAVITTNTLPPVVVIDSVSPVLT
jgi:hypothetical protein